MKILSKKKQRELMYDLLDIYQLGSDAMEAIGTQQASQYTISRK